MNVKIEKKIYSAPKMSVMDMRGTVSLLSGSIEGAPAPEDGHGMFDYDDELGFRSLSDINRKV